MSSGRPPVVYRFGGELGQSPPQALKGSKRSDDKSPVRQGEVVVAELWGTEGIPAQSYEDPTLHAATFDVECRPGATRWRLVQMGPYRTSASHRTGTLDYDVVLSGWVDLSFENCEVRLSPGDTVILPGVVHTWRTGDVACTMAVAMIGLQGDRAVDDAV